MKIAMGVRQRDAGTPLTPGSSQQDHVDHNTCVLTTRTLQGLGPCRGPQRQQTPCCRVRPGERGAPRRSGGCALGSRGQRIAGVPHRPVVVVSISSGRPAGHVPSPDEARGRGLAPRFSGLQDAPSACPLRRSRTWTRLNLFEANGTDSKPVTMCSSTTICVARHCPGSTWTPQSPARRAPRSGRGLTSGSGPWRLSRLCTPKMENKHSRKGKSRLRLLMAAATFQRYQWYLINARLPAGGPPGHRDMR